MLRLKWNLDDFWAEVKSSRTYKRFPDGSYRHPRAIVNDSAVLGKNCVITEDAVVGEGATLLHDVIVGPMAYVDNNAVIHNNVILHERAYVGGKTVVHEGCTLGVGSGVKDGAVIGQFTNVGSSTTVGLNTRILPASSIGSWSYIESDTPIFAAIVPQIKAVLAHQVTAFSNGDVSVGCQRRPIDEWLKTYEKIGKSRGLSNGEIELYHLSLLTAKALINVWDRDARAARKKVKTAKTS